MIAEPALAEAAAAVKALVGLVFLSAAIGKMRNWIPLQGVIANYRLLPDILVAPVAYVLPPVEALLGAALLLAVFAAAMGINLLRGRRHIDCGCFQSALRQSLSWILVARNGALVLLLVLAMLFAQFPPTRGARIAGLLAGAVLYVILQSLNILWSIVPSWRRPGTPGPEAQRTSPRRTPQRPLAHFSGVDP
jgi:hypothetical protein